MSLTSGISAAVSAFSESSPRASIIGENELRGVWIATVQNINFPSKPGADAVQMRSEIDDIIKTCKEANLNAIFFQVRPASDAMYASRIFPSSKYLTGTQGAPLPDGFDPLEYITERAHANNIELHAWINPYRITAGTAGSPEHDISALAASHPARTNPEWVVKYADGKMYYNPGLPEVRKLITDGVMEIVKNYDVDGIHFDDYFYPYPVTGAAFDDDAAFKKYAPANQSLADFRRANVNTLVKNVYDEIKKVNPSVRFGISPFGIWANQSSISTGSATNGLQAYSAIYSDAKAWIEGGCIDYICPQIYWSFATEVARFDRLVRWWSAAVDGTGVDLYIGHAAYKVPDWKSELELLQQVEYGRAYMGVAGSVFYGYSNIAANDYKTKDNLAKLFAAPRVLTKPANTGGGIAAGRPLAGTTVTTAYVNIMAGSNPAYPVYYNGQKLARTKSGYFTLYAPLVDGRNNFNFVSNGETHTYVVHRGARAAAAPSVYVHPQMDSYKIEIIRPLNDIITDPGDKIELRVQAPSGSDVTARLGAAVISLTSSTNPPNEGPYMAAEYTGTITLPSTQPQGELINLGNLVFTASRGAETASAGGINIKLINATAYRPAEVTKDYTPFKISPDSDSYDDYLYASVGMRDNVVAFKDGYYRLGCGGFIPAANAVLTPERTLLVNRILSAAMLDTGKFTEIRFAVTENVPVDAVCKDGVFRLTLFNSPEGARRLELTDNPIFKSVRNSSDKTKRTVTYAFDLIHADNWYGFEVVYEGGFIVFKVKNPMKKPTGSRPLEGMTIVVDAGHGGNDPGALGFLPGKNEADLNLDISLALRNKLRALGADVVMTRESDISMGATSSAAVSRRMAVLVAAKPDLMISVHHNSMTDAQDNTYIRGFLGLYTNDSGRLLTKSVSRVLSAELNRFERAPRYQALGVLRNYKFPATLLEMSFITNPDEYEFSASAEGVRRSVDGIANGILAWIDDQQKWVK